MKMKWKLMMTSRSSKNQQQRRKTTTRKQLIKVSKKRKLLEVGRSTRAKLTMVTKKMSKT